VIDHLPRLHAELDEVLGVDQTWPGIVSVWADRDGQALVWQRDGQQLRCTRQRFRPWLFATTLDDLDHLGPALAPAPLDTPSPSRFSYTELDGPPGSYRYLLSARSGRALEQAILAGARQRLGQPVTRLNSLEDYYQVAPVEQYLMQTGQVYFRDLQYADLHRLQFDLETTALDPQQGRIFLVALRDSRGLATTLEAPDPHQERQLLADLCALICERDPDIIENHNLFGFDLPFLVARAAALRLPLHLGRKPGPTRLEHYQEGSGWQGRPRTRFRLAGRELIDTLDAVRRHDFVARDLPSHRLKDVARAFGLASAERVYLAGERLVSTYHEQPDLVRRYALDDVQEVDGLSQRLMGATFALARLAPRPYERLSAAGPAMGILEPMLVRTYLRAGAALPQYGSDGGTYEGNHAGGAAYLFATGVAQQVVKADIASLYPSLMRAYAIGPASDRLGILLSIVSRLTDLRLSHKTAARQAPPHSLAAGYHNAMQAAMKLLINSAYGYMGAGRMALFADRAAADEVTRRGREVLEQVVAELRSRGMALLEADTDGVYFAAPLGWTEAQERALVAEVAATLPPTLRLEYEGRYRAMLSHEIKNYALLTYSGDVILRGVALRSSRAEPFGERFLYQALHCTLTGDTPGLRAAFLDMVAALRNRTLPAADVASRVRLSKTPDTYLTSRATHRELPYEALLAAGRTTWTVGERVRCYRAQDGQAVWLPDSSDEAPADQAGTPLDQRRDYDVDHYLQVLVSSYASRLRKAFAPQDFEQLFRLSAQLGLFDCAIETIQPRWVRCTDHQQQTSDAVAPSTARLS
jgi:DNA polymerase I